MKTIKIFFVAILISLGATSCLLDQTTTDYSDSVSVLGFSNANMNLTFFTDNGDQQVNIPVRIDGPQKYDISTPVTATVTVDPSSTAVEGVHYTIADTSVSLDPNNNLLDVINLTVITDGVDPLTITEDPVLVLTLSDISDPNVLSNGRSEKVTITIKYLCESDMAGDYSNPDLPSGANGIATLTSVADGRYKVSALPYLGWGGSGPIYYYMVDFCGELTYDGGELEENGYEVTAWFDNNGDGSFTIYYSVLSFDFTNSPSTYTPL
jgi:hypothetical protein